MQAAHRQQHNKKKYSRRCYEFESSHITIAAVAHTGFMTLRKKIVVRIVKREYNSTEWVMMMRNQEIDKRRKFSQPNSYQMMCCLDFYCFHFSSLLFFSSFFSIRSRALISNFIFSSYSVKLKCKKRSQRCVYK